MARATVPSELAQDAERSESRQKLIYTARSLMEEIARPHVALIALVQPSAEDIQNITDTFRSNPELKDFIDGDTVDLHEPDEGDIDACLRDVGYKFAMPWINAVLKGEKDCLGKTLAFLERRYPIRNGTIDFEGIHLPATEILQKFDTQMRIRHAELIGKFTEDASG